MDPMNAKTLEFLSQRKDETLTATFYLNSKKKISNCPDVIGAIFGKRKSDFITDQELIPLYLKHVKELIKQKDTTVYISELQLREKIVLKISYSDLSVEFAIGFYFLNSLRSTIPNFMQTYSLFTCGGYDGSGSICSTGRSQAQFLAIENIESDINTKEYIGTAPIGNVYLLILQVILAIRTANRRFGFNHYDAHPGNIMLKKVPPTAITYDETTIVVDHIAVLIDYGRSRVKVDDDHYLWWSAGKNHYTQSKMEIDIVIIVRDMAKFLPYQSYPTNELGLMSLRNDINGGIITQEIIDFLIEKSTKLTAVNSYNPDTCKRRNRRTPVTSVLDYYEGYPYSKNREVDVQRILDEAIADIENARMDSPTYKTICKLYVFFYRSKVDSIPVDENYQLWYSKCSYFLS